MCGIFLELTSSNAVVLKDNDIIKQLVRRGPNSVCLKEYLIPNNFKAYLYGAVLWMQGSELTSQPVVHEKGFLLYNGDIFDESWTTGRSDTDVIMEKLTTVQDESSEDIIEVLESLIGPFSIIFYNQRSQDLYFARDRIGRTSLLFHKAETIVISSVLSRKYQCIEVPATHIHKYNLVSNTMESIPWSGGAREVFQLDEWWRAARKMQNLSDEEFPVPVVSEVDINAENDVVDYIQQVSEESNSSLTKVEKFLQHSTISKVVVQLIDLLEKSVKIRLERQPKKCTDCVANNVVGPCDHCVVGVLFSGGLDCTILSLLADKFVPEEQSIDLLNVAFKKDTSSSYDVPDRLTGRQSYGELMKLRPQRKWRFCEIDVPHEEMVACQRAAVADLVHPRNTVLDESLGTALWCAARGLDNRGRVSSCRLLLVGAGADELFGGYTRHRTALRRGGWAALRGELHRDVTRLPRRNLARDHRVLTAHGRQPRLPFLDERIVSYVTRLEPWLRCYPSAELGPGVGDKLMLRLVAFQLGLTQVAFFPKRALQFGSRIANKKEKGSDLSKNFINQ